MPIKPLEFNLIDSDINVRVRQCIGKSHKDMHYINCWKSSPSQNSHRLLWMEGKISESITNQIADQDQMWKHILWQTGITCVPADNSQSLISIHVKVCVAPFIYPMVLTWCTGRTAHVLNSIAVHFKSAEQIVLLTLSVLTRALMSSSKLRIDSYLLVVTLCHNLYISTVNRNNICLSKSAILAMFF